MLSLELRGCPRLIDWSAIEGASLNALELAWVETLPDFTGMTFHKLKLDSLDWVEDLSCLDGLDADYTGYQVFSLPGMDRIQDARARSPA